MGGYYMRDNGMLLQASQTSLYADLEQRLLAQGSSAEVVQLRRPAGKRVTLLDLLVYYSTDDLHVARAAHEYGVAAEAVTQAQRRTSKELNYGFMYGATEL